MKKLFKVFTGFGALILLLIGVAMLALTVYGYINNSIFVGDTNTQNTILGIMLGVSLAIITGAAEGIYGICAEKPKLICFFQILVILFMIIFIGVGVGLVYLPEAFFNGDCATSTNSVIQYANNIYTTSQASYCIGCTCALDTSNTALNQKYSDPADIAYIQATYINTNTATGAHTTDGCIKDQLSPAQTALFTTMGELEKFLGCSDWCAPVAPYRSLIYRFNDINSGKPDYTCYDRLLDVFNNYSYYGKLGFFIGGGVLFLMFACNMYICCSPERKNKKLRERFMYMQQTDDIDDRYRRY